MESDAVAQAKAYEHMSRVVREKQEAAKRQKMRNLLARFIDTEIIEQLGVHYDLAYDTDKPNRFSDPLVTIIGNLHKVVFRLIKIDENGEAWHLIVLAKL